MERLRISYLLPDFDEHAHSGGLYVIFQHCNGLLRRGHIVRAFNAIGKKSRHLRLECDVENHRNDPSIVEGNSPHILIGTHWRTYFFLSRMREVMKNGTALCLLVQSNDRFLVGDEERPLVSKALSGTYDGHIPIHKIAVSAYLRDMLMAEFGQESLYVRNGIEIHDVAPLLAPTKKVRIVARYDTSGYRGWHIIDKVLERVSKERDDIEIHLFEMKRKRPTTYRSFFHKGLVGEGLLRLFRSCDIYLAASTYEGFSYPTIEAMSQGACVCCTDAGGNREFCIDGETALVSDREDADGLYNNLTRLIRDRNLMNGLKENGIRKARDFQWGRGIDALEEFFGSISAKARAMAHGNSHREETPSYRERGSIFFICNKDPLSDYRDWLKVDETMKCFSDSRFVVEALLFVDAHPNKSVRARMGMLAPTTGAHRFRWRSFYHRRMKFKLDFLNRSIFLASAIFQLCAGVLLFRKRYAGVVFAEGTSPTLQFVCTLLRVPFHSIRLNNPRLKGYSFHLYTRDYALKEEGFRGLVREMLVASIDMRAFSHNLHDG